MEDNGLHKKIAVVLIYIAAAAAAWLIIRYLWGALIPFVIAYALAECFKPLIRHSEKHGRFPVRITVAAVLLIATGAVLMLIFAAAREVLREAGGFINGLRDAIVQIRDDENFACEVIDRICKAVPFPGLKDRLWEIRPEIDEKLLSAALSYADRIAEGIIGVAGGAMTFFPDALLTFAVTVISAYYFAVDRVRVNCFFLSLFPKKVRPLLKKAKDEVCDTAFKFIRAYFLIFLMTFAMLLAAFLAIGADYALFIALAVAAIDILPVLGTGTVLIPWGIISIASGNTGTGIALLATYAVITAVRQIAEPKIV
ncbi:MAG: AI-2E family transporter, partial [Clostridia bacterium]|nr:AI-2E family transporter [Clostridia bacterium]